MISISFSAENISELKEKIEKFLSSLETSSSKKGRAKKEDTPKIQPKVEAVEVSEEVKIPIFQSDSDEKKVSKEEIVPLMERIFQTPSLGAPAILNVLAEFSASKLAEVKESDFPKLKEKLEALLKA